MTQKAMLAADPLVFNTKNRVPSPCFKQATLLSLLFHTFLLLFIAQQSNQTAYRKSDTKQPIRIYFQTGEVENNQLQKQIEELPPSNTSEQAEQALAEASPDQAPQDVAPITAQRLRHTKPSTRKNAKEITPKAQTFNLDDAKKSLHLLSHSNISRCNQKERESKVHNCNHDDLQLRNQRQKNYQVAIASAFKRPEKSVSEIFNRNMARVENLLLLQDQLEKQIDTSNPAHQLLIEEHRAITNEIQMIDKQYQEMNLLKVLGSGIKTIRNATKNED